MQNQSYRAEGHNMKQLWGQSGIFQFENPMLGIENQTKTTIQNGSSQLPA
jgi:hypothetical protein